MDTSEKDGKIIFFPTEKEIQTLCEKFDIESDSVQIICALANVQNFEQLEKEIKATLDRYEIIDKTK